MSDETKNTNEVVETTKAGEVALTPTQIALLQKHSGKQTFTVQELLIPQFKIVQTQSGYMKRSDAEYIAEAKEGQFIDTLNAEPFDGPAQVIVVRFATNYFENKPYPGGLVKAWGQDSSGYDRAAGDFGTRITKDGNEIDPLGSYHVLLLQKDGTPLPCMMYLGSTAWKEARRLNTWIGSLQLMSEDGPFIAAPYTRVYNVTSVPMSNERNSWMGWKFTRGPLTQTLKFGDAILKQCIAFEESIDKGLVKVEGDAPARDGTGPVMDNEPRPTNGQAPPDASGKDEEIPF